MNENRYIEMGVKIDSMGRPIKGQYVYRIVEDTEDGFTVLGRYVTQDEAQAAFKKLAKAS